MSDRSRGEGWWQAADGKWYPPELLDAPRQQWPTTELTPIVPPASGVDVGAGVAAQVSVAVASLLMFGVGASGIVFAGSVRSAGDGWVDRAVPLDGEALWAALSVLSLLALLVAAPIVIVWLFRTSKAMTARGAEGRRWSPGWAIGSWFVPFANLILPRLVVAEIEKCVSEPYSGTPIGDRWATHQRFTMGDVWWFLWVAGNVVSYLGTVAGNPTVDTAGRYATYVTIGSMGSFVVAVAGVVLVLEIRAIVAAASRKI